MENMIKFNGVEKKWEYNICPCLECPIYPLQKEWENERDIRKDKCHTSGCTYNKINASQIANGIYIIMHSYYCEECEEYFPKGDLNEPICPNCGNDIN